MRPVTRSDGSDNSRVSRSGSESAKQEALSLMAHGELVDPAWNMDSLKTAILFADVHSVRQVFERSTFRPRTPGFTTLINFFGRLRDWKRAHGVFRAMTSVYDIPANTYTYSALISACSSSGEWERALDIFGEMKEVASSNLSSNCQPNAVTYSAVMTACERGGQCERAVELYYDMEAAGVEPDQGTFTAAMSSCLATEGWRETEKILEKMHKAGFSAPIALYGDLMAKYAANREYVKGLELFLAIQVVGVNLDIHVCRNLMSSLEGGERPDMAVDLLSTMRKAGIEIDLETYNSALHSLAACGLFTQALAVFESIERDGLVHDVHSVAELVSAYRNGGEVETAEQLKEEYKAKGLDIDNPMKEDVDAIFLAACSISASDSHSAVGSQEQ